MGKIIYIDKVDFEESFLSSLYELHDCPKGIYVCGNLPTREKYKYITIVGSRAHSAYAQEALEKLIANLVGQSVCIISGLAHGIDAHAHKLALSYGVPTIALPGSGLGGEVLYPRINKKLAEDIVSSGGALISEFTSETRAARWTFPKRNRLMAILSDMVLVVEASEQSGTLITARQAVEYNRDLGVLPASIFSETARGSNRLMQEGAYPILSAEDITSLLGITHVQDTNKKARDDISLAEQEILDTLQEPLSRDEILHKTEYKVEDLATLLSLLEIKGYIKEQMGMIYKV